MTQRPLAEAPGADRLDAAVGRPLLTVIGEALIDLVPGSAPGDYRARAGGSPFNVAIGLARLGHRTALMARLADNAFGRLLRDHAAAEGVELSSAPRATEPTTLAVVSLDAEGHAAYDFYLDGTADWQWTGAELADIPPQTAVLHVGSLAAWTAPGDRHIRAAAAAVREHGALISYDPNIRPLLLGDPERARPLVEEFVGVAHLVKASREDVAWLYPGAGLDEISTRWLDLGALAVVVTDGPHGAYFSRDARTTLTHRPGRKITLVDTIGAGDAFTSGLLGGLVRRGLHTPSRLSQCPDTMLAEVVDEAVLVSALTCERIGADPPFAAALT